MASNIDRSRRVGVVESLLSELTKQSASNTEPGSIGGPSSHPTANADDKTQAATTGERYSEHSSDNKAEPNRGVTVDATAPRTGGDQDSVQVNIGLTNKATGEDPSNETSSTKPNKEDGSIGGASSHPARTDNTELDGRKYASQFEHFEALLKRANDLGSAVAAAIAVELEKVANTDNDTGPAPPTTKQLDANDKPVVTADKADESISNSSPLPEEGKDKKAEDAGAELADIFAKAALPAEDALAIKQAALQYTVQIIETAEHRAKLAAEFFDAHIAQLKKLAEEECEDESEGESEEKSEGKSEEKSEKKPSEGGGESKSAPPSEGGGAPPAPAPTAGGPSEQDLMALLGAGEGMGGEGAVDGMDQTDDMAGLGAGGDPAMGGAPPMDPMAGGAPPMDPMAGGMGGDPAMGGGMGGGDEMAALEQALAELGITPEQLQMLLAQQKTAAAKKAAATKQAAERAKKASPAFQQKTASMKKMIQELVSRSRG